MSIKQFQILLGILLFLFIIGMAKTYFEVSYETYIQKEQKQARIERLAYNTITYIPEEKNLTKTILEPIWEEYTITAYCAEKYPHICNDGSYDTATGTIPTVGRTIAVDPKFIQYGSKIEIEGLGEYVAEDCGGAIKKNRLDILFLTHEEALEFGIKNMKGRIIK